MTDRMLKVEDVIAEIDFRIEATKWFPEVPGTDQVIKSLSLLKEKINSGQLDADRPECPKCNDTGTEEIRRRGGITEQWPCDCKASK